MAILNEVIAVGTELNKQIVLRTFQAAFIHDLHGHPGWRRSGEPLPGSRSRYK